MPLAPPARGVAHCWATLGVTFVPFTSILQTDLPVVDDDQGPTSRPRAGGVMVAPPLNHMYCGKTSEHREVAAAASWGVPRQGQGLHRRGSQLAA
jgi:hypothetical protein